MTGLFMMECRKAARGVAYWLFVLALLFVSIRQFDAAVDSELRRKDDPLSVFLQRRMACMLGILKDCLTGRCRKI